MSIEQGTLFEDGGQPEVLKPHGKYKHFTMAEKSAIAVAWQRGVPLLTIASQLGVRPATVTRLLRRIGSPRRRRATTDDQRLLIVRLWRDGQSVKEIASTADADKETVRKTVKAAGLWDKDGNSKFTIAEQEQIASEYASGVSSKSLAKKYHTWANVIMNVVRKHGIPVRRPNADLPPTHKRCPKCKEVKSRSDGFYEITFADGTSHLSSVCKECGKADCRRPERRKKEQERRRQIRLRAISAYGGNCVCCGEARWEFLTVDHTGKGGHQHRKQLKKKGAEFYRWLEKQGWPQDDYRLLCYCCNLADGFYGCCPHVGEPVLSQTVHARHKQKLRRQAITAYGGKCECCGQSEPRFLAIDHVGGGGCRERAGGKQLGSLLYELKRNGWPRGAIRVLCHNCNCARGITGYCPCGRERGLI